jgi:hypothetical protein
MAADIFANLDASAHHVAGTANVEAIANAAINANLNFMVPPSKRKSASSGLSLGRQTTPCGNRE